MFVFNQDIYYILQREEFATILSKGAFNTYVDKMMGGGGQKMFVFGHAQAETLREFFIKQK